MGKTYIADSFKNPEGVDLFIDKLSKGGYTGTAQDLQTEIASILADVRFLADVTPSTDISAELGNIYTIVAEAGTYTFWNSIIVPANTFAVLKRVDGIFSSSQTALDLVNYALKTDLKTQFVKGTAADLNTLTKNGILEVEFYNSADSEIFYHYGIGNNYINATHYLSFISSINPLDYIIPVEWNSQTLASGGVALSGVKSYFIRRKSDNILKKAIGRVIVNWDNVPSGQRYVEASTLSTNSQYLLSTKKVYDTNKINTLVLKKYPFNSKATISEDAKDVFQAFERLELYGANHLKKYYLKTFARNRALNGSYYIIIEEEGHSNTTGIAFFNTSLVENSSGVNVVGLASSDNSGITGKVWIDWKKLTLLEYPGLTQYTLEQTQLSSLVHSSQTVTSAPFSETNDRLIVGDNLYLVDEDNLQLNKNSMISSEYYGGELGIMTNILDEPFSNWFNKSLIVNASKYTDGITARIFNKISGDTNLYYKDVNVKKVLKSTLTAKTCELFIFGDSITDGVSSAQAVTPYVANNLITKWGANPTFRGLRSDGGYANEGRSSWEYADLIGLTTNNAATGLPTDLNTATNSAQPFTKIATAGQISANPTWCFENTRVTTGTGKTRELNYTESQAIGTYTGDYYTFDFARYVSLNLGGIDMAKKLIVTNALGFNDMNHNGETLQAKNDVLLGMEIFYARVKEFKADAIIGFVPVVVVNENNSWAEYANLIELAIKKANTLGAGIVPVWQHVDRYASFDYSTATALSSDNNSKKGTSLDSIHPTAFGAKQYANALSNYIANKL